MSQIKLLIFFAFFFALTNTANAGEWKKVAPRDAKIELRTDWSWAAPENGRYSERWADNNVVYLFTGTWGSGTFPGIEILVQRLTTLYYWKPPPKMDEQSLFFWRHLEKVGVSEIRKVPCDALDCVAFKALHSRCVGFQFVDGSLGNRQEQGSDFVRGYYCSGSSEEIAPEQVNEMLRSIVVKKKKWN